MGEAFKKQMMSDDGLLALLAGQIIAMHGTGALDDAIDRALQRMDGKRLDARIGTVTLDEAGARLNCKNRAQTLATLSKLGIPVIRISAKKKLVAVAAIESALAKREVRAGGLLGKHRKPNSKDGALDTELVLLLGLTLAVVGTVLVLGGLGVMWLVLLKQWVLGVGNRRKLRFSSRQMGRVESATTSWAGKAHSGLSPEKDHAPSGCNASAGSDFLS